MHGWYSVRQAKLGGTVFYSTPDGQEIEVSQVDSDPDYKSKWEDAVYLGSVVKFVRRGSSGLLDEVGEEPTIENIEKLHKICQDAISERDTYQKDKARWN